MSKSNSGIKAKDQSGTKNKGEQENTRQKGAASVSKKGKEPHRKDESDGAAKNTTKKQANSI